MTLTEFTKMTTNINPKLIRATVRQFGGWGSFQESAPDVVNHGIDGGFHGFIYYSDTCTFFKRNKKLILGLAEDMSSDFGQGMLEMIRGFGVFKNEPIAEDVVARSIYTGKGDDVTTVFNAMSWYAAEEMCRAYVDLLEREND